MLGIRELQVGETPSRVQDRLDRGPLEGRGTASPAGRCRARHRPDGVRAGGRRPGVRRGRGRDRCPSATAARRISSNRLSRSRPPTCTMPDRLGFGEPDEDSRGGAVVERRAELVLEERTAARPGAGRRSPGRRSRGGRDGVGPYSRLSRATRPRGAASTYDSASRLVRPYARIGRAGSSSRFQDFEPSKTRSVEVNTSRRPRPSAHSASRRVASTLTARARAGSRRTASAELRAAGVDHGLRIRLGRAPGDRRRHRPARPAAARPRRARPGVVPLQANTS